jgi:hypothetical protein
MRRLAESASALCLGKHKAEDGVNEGLARAVMHTVNWGIFHTFESASTLWTSQPALRVLEATLAVNKVGQAHMHELVLAVHANEAAAMEKDASAPIKIVSNPANVRKRALAAVMESKTHSLGTLQGTVENALAVVLKGQSWMDVYVDRSEDNDWIPDFLEDMAEDMSEMTIFGNSTNPLSRLSKEEADRARQISCFVHDVSEAIIANLADLKAKKRAVFNDMRAATTMQTSFASIPVRLGCAASIYDDTDDSVDMFAGCMAPSAMMGLQPMPSKKDVTAWLQSEPAADGTLRDPELMQQDLTGATSNAPPPQALPAAANIQGPSGTQQFLVQALGLKNR